jgi:hypothetical protein
MKPVPLTAVGGANLRERRDALAGIEPVRISLALRENPPA